MRLYTITFKDGSERKVEAAGYTDDSGWFRPASQFIFLSSLGSCMMNIRPQACLVVPVEAVRSIERSES